MQFLGLAFLLLAHFLSGHGLLHMLRLKFDLIKHVALSVLTGIVLLSFVPFILQLMYVPITFNSVFVGIVLVCLLMNLTGLKSLKGISFKGLKEKLIPRFKIYEWPFVIIVTLALMSSFWRSFYYPPNARDMLSGPEVVAEYTVKEHSMINSVFTINLETTNNHLKPPYVMDLQIIYKLFGFPFGQVWVSFVGIFFMVFLYRLLRERIHPALAGALLVVFLAIPEVFAYTYVMLFDYSNMVFFFLGVYYLYDYVKTSENKYFYFATILLAFATFVRLETLILIAMLLPVLWVNGFRKKISIPKIGIQSALLLALPFLFYFLWVNVYVKNYLPAQFSLTSEINSNLKDISPLFTRFKEMNTQLLFGKWAQPLWAHFITIFLVLAVAELVVVRKLSKETLFWYYAVAIVYFGLPLMGYLLPLMDLLNTTKRGLFKMMPFMLLILANNGLLQRLSASIVNWESESGEEKTTRKVSGKTAVNSGKMKSAR